MNSYRKNAIAAGSLFIIAIIASLLGGGLIESILAAPDYLASLTANTSTLIIGIFLEFINAFAVIGIAITLFPTLRKHNESIANGYISFRIIESIFCIVSALIPLTLISLSHAYLKESALDISNFQALGALLISIRASLAEIVIPISFGLGALLFYHMLFYSKLIPRFISVWGLLGVILVLTLVFIKINTIINLTLVLPIILNEIFLGIWLIIKGFNPFVGNGWSA